MSTVGDIGERKERPAYVRFQRRAIEDRTVQRPGGGWPKRDVDYALITPPYSRDVFEQVATEWLAQMRVEVQNGRVPQEWYERWEQMYEKWKSGQEMPLDGEPIKGWGVISPAQQANLIALNILTVEDLAAVNDEGLRRIGMGSGELRTKAKAWLQQMKDKGPLTQKIALVEAENDALKAENASLKANIKEMGERIEILQRGGLERDRHFDRRPDPEEEIRASDVLPEPEPQQKPRKSRATAQVGEL